MNWITTNIRLPEDIYMEFKMQAARERKSVAEIMREKLIPKKKPQKINVKKFLKELKKLAAENRKQNPKLNLTKALIEMRYEQ
ncbi:hypothetical protein HY338_03775 [Candidatus Gottesmanbacteria bacterium]|nr:hypothetical protein [Candidatus Gottesmanbacteria bacterium]